jgi:ketosteroid isomerase-like protein
MAQTQTNDAVATFLDATKARDIDRIVSTLAPDAELLSPLSGRMVFRGRDDLRVLLGAVYGGLSNLIRRAIHDRLVGGDDAHRHVVAHRFTTDDARRLLVAQDPRAPDPGRGAAARTRSLHRAYLNRLPLRSHRNRRHGRGPGGGLPFVPVFTCAATSLTVPSTVSELSNSCPISDHCR